MRFSSLFFFFSPLTVIKFRAFSKVEETFGAYFPFFFWLMILISLADFLRLRRSRYYQWFLYLCANEFNLEAMRLNSLRLMYECIYLLGDLFDSYIYIHAHSC